MTINMYSEKVAGASALIREFAKVDYFHYFARDPESSLEGFIAMLEQAEEKGRQSQVSRIADLERQLAEASALAVEPPIGHISKGMLEQLRERLGVSGYVQSGRTEEFPVALYATPQAADTDIPEALELLAAVFDAWENGDDCYEDPHAAAGYLGKAFRLNDDVFKRCCELLNRRNPPRNAPLPAADTDKVREAILAMRCTNPYAEDKCNLYKEGYAVARKEAADLVASMAAQAPVREVPGWQPIETAPKDGSEVLLWLPAPYNRITKARWFDLWENWQDGEFPSDNDEYCGIGSKLPTHYMPLPAAPVQQEGAKP